MITFFTTLKPFIGQNKINQVNALRNWREMVPGCEVLVFDRPVEADDLINELEIKVLDVKKYAGLPLPLVNDMFYKAEDAASNAICCFINADILLPRHFAEQINKIHQRIKKQYLLVGQRYDLDVKDYLLFNDKKWEVNLQRTGNMVLHPAFGSDFFIFPKNQYLPGDIPDLVVGRPGWDNWFIYNGVMVKKISVIDISNALIVYHQNHEPAYVNSMTDMHIVDAATKHNLRFLPKNEEFNFALDRTNYYMADGRPKKRKESTAAHAAKTLIKKWIRKLS